MFKERNPGGRHDARKIKLRLPFSRTRLSATANQPNSVFRRKRLAERPMSGVLRYETRVVNEADQTKKSSR